MRTQGLTVISETKQNENLFLSGNVPKRLMLQSNKYRYSFCKLQILQKFHFVPFIHFVLQITVSGLKSQPFIGTATIPPRCI